MNARSISVPWLTYSRISTYARANGLSLAQALERMCGLPMSARGWRATAVPVSERLRRKIGGSPATARKRLDAAIVRALEACSG